MHGSSSTHSEVQAIATSRAHGESLGGSHSVSVGEGHASSVGGVPSISLSKSFQWQSNVATRLTEMLREQEVCWIR